jgi:hypothetical protein
MVSSRESNRNSVESSTEADGDVIMMDERSTSERKNRLWWLNSFDFHTKNIDRRAYTVRGNNYERAVLHTKMKRQDCGIRQLWPQSWYLNDSSLIEHQQDVNCRSPSLVNSILTDGVQVKVQLCSRIKEESGNGTDPAYGSMRLAEAGSQSYRS